MWRSRIDNKLGSWAAGVANKDQWIQWDLGEVRNITKLIIKGHGTNGWYTKSFRMAYATRLNKMQLYRFGSIIQANTDKDTAVTVELQGFEARFVRIMPW